MLPRQDSLPDVTVVTSIPTLAHRCHLEWGRPSHCFPASDSRHRAADAARLRMRAGCVDTSRGFHRAHAAILGAPRPQRGKWHGFRRSLPELGKARLIETRKIAGYTLAHTRWSRDADRIRARGARIHLPHASTSSNDGIASTHRLRPRIGSRGQCRYPR